MFSDPSTVDLFTPIAAELGEMLDVLDRDGGGYARRYLAHIREGGQGYGPRAPLGMHPLVAKAVRGVVRDHFEMARFENGKARAA